MASVSALYSRADDSILQGAVVTGTAPLATYALSTLLSGLALARVRWGVTTVQIVLTLPAPRRADVFVPPVWNVDAGASVAVLSNGAGLSQALTVPTIPPNGIPEFAPMDLRIGTPTGATRTSNVWTVDITGNSINVIAGGLMWLGQLRSFDRNLVWNATDEETAHVDITPNVYGTDYVVDYETASGGATVAFDDATDADRNALKAWQRSTHGGALPSFFWVDPTVQTSGLIGRWPRKYSALFQFLNLNKVPLTFTGLTKGKPV